MRKLSFLLSSGLAVVVGGVASAAGAETAAIISPSKVVEVGTRPESVVKGFEGKYYVSVMNGDAAPGDGVVKVFGGKGDEPVREFATGLDEPKGMCFTGKFLIVADLKRVWKIDAKGDKSELAPTSAFSTPPSYLNDVGCEPGGQAVYVSDMGANTKMRDPDKKLWPLDSEGAKALPAIGRIYRIGLDGKITVAVDSRPEMPCPNGVTAPARGRLLVAEFFTGTIYDVRGKGFSPIVTGLRGADGLEEHRGMVYVSSWEQGKLWRFRPGKAEAGKPAPKDLTVIADGYKSAADFFLDRQANRILLPDMKAGTVSFLELR